MNLDNYRLSRKILRLANLDLQRRNAHLQGMDLTFEQSDTLQYVYFHADCSIRELAQFLEVSHQTAQGIASRMVKKDLLKRIPSDQDRRRVKLRLTGLGEEKLQTILHNGTMTAQVIHQGMSEAEQEEFSRLLDLAIFNLKEDRKNL